MSKKHNTNAFEIDNMVEDELIEEPVVEEIGEEVYSEEPVVIAKTVNVTVDVDLLNVREEANSNSRIINVIDRGTVLEGNFEDDWFKNVNGGYVMSKFVK